MKQPSAQIYANFSAFQKHSQFAPELVSRVVKISLSLSFCVLFLLFNSPLSAQNLPDKIRGYKVHKAEISVKTDENKNETKADFEAFVKIGEPQLAEISLAGVTIEIPAEISGLQQSGQVHFLTFHDFRVNDLPVEIEEYKESFSFAKNQTVVLPKPARIFLGAAQTLRGAFNEIKESKNEWSVTGRVFVFGKFKKFGFNFKRVVPVEIDIKIKNPLRRSDSRKHDQS